MGLKGLSLLSILRKMLQFKNMLWRQCSEEGARASKTTNSPLPPPPVNKETNINALFGTGPGQKPDPTVAKSPATRK